MWRKILVVITIIIIAQTFANFVEGDVQNAQTGVFLSSTFSLWTALVFARRWRKTRKKLGITPKIKDARESGIRVHLRSLCERVKVSIDAKADKLKRVRKALKKATERRPQNNKSYKSLSPRQEAKFEPIMNAARRLRKIATDFEDPKQVVVLRLEPLNVTRSTKTQNYWGRGGLMVKRDGVLVGYSNANSREPKRKQLDKKWSQIIGVVPNRFEIYYQDHSSFEFEPLNLEDFLVLTVFWQVFHDDLNGNPEEIIDPRGSILGQKLRKVADHIDENREQLLASKGAISLDRFDFSALAPSLEEPKAFKRPVIGTIIDDYKLEKQLGAGAFGTVFLAREINDPEDHVAFKLMNLPPESGIKVGTPAFFHQAEQFIEEGKKSLNFTNVAYVLNAIEFGTEPWPWIAYPLVKGQSVGSLMDAGRLSDSSWWNLAHDLLSGLRSIHIEGLVHLDIKPDNIMLSEDRFMILDLGVASIQGYEFGKPPSGTIIFMAPEVLEARLTNNANIPITGAADVFSAGLTLLWCATQRYYFEGLEFQSTKELEVAIYELLNSGGVKVFDLPGGRQELLEKMLLLDPKKRPTANDLLFEIAPYVDLEKKIAQVEMANVEISEMALENLEGGETSKLNKKLKGPFKSWVAFGAQIRMIIEEVRPAYFAIEFHFNSSREFIYIQALYAGNGWVMECMSELFTEQDFAIKQKQRLLQLGWSPPSDSSPNYERIEGMLNPNDMTTKFVTALEQAYQIKISDVSHMKLSAQNKNAY